MPFASEEAIQSSLTSDENLKNRLVHHISRVGKRGTEIPQEVRNVVTAVLEESGEAQIEIAKVFGLSGESVHAYAKGQNTPGRGSNKNEELVRVKTEMQDKRKDVEDKAISALVESLEIMTPKLADVRKPKVLSSIAKDMAFIADKMRPASEREGLVTPQIHFHIPDRKKLSDYEVIDATPTT
jgi:predicted transcriptional regulator